MSQIKTPDLLEISQIADALVAPASYSFNFGQGVSTPSLSVLEELMGRLKAVFFPGYHTKGYASESSLRYHMEANLDSIYRMLAGQIANGFSVVQAGSGEPCMRIEEAHNLSALFVKELPMIRTMLDYDVTAAYEGDPAAKSKSETIFCYPSVSVMTYHRVAHALYKLGIPLIPRIISEMSHSMTGVDIHPGATIGRSFFIDHGTGVVIGETAIIGSRCRLYQGVTLGALSFPKGEDGTLVKNLARHPVLEDDVVVYAGATVLGRVTIGAGTMIGGNVWITKDVPAGSKVVQQHSTRATEGDKLVGKTCA